MVLVHSHRVLGHQPQGSNTREPPVPFWRSCEGDFHTFALYYGLQELSVKASALPLMRKGAKTTLFSLFIAASFQAPVPLWIS